MIQARDVMTPNVTTIAEDLPVKKMIQIIRNTGFSGFPVVDASGRASGLVSQNDVLRALAWAVEAAALKKSIRKGKGGTRVRLPRGKGGVAGLLERPVKELMTSGILSCSPDAPATEICETMVSKRIHRLVVLDEDGRVVGLISASDLVKKFGEHLRGAQAPAGV